MVCFPLYRSWAFIWPIRTCDGQIQEKEMVSCDCSPAHVPHVHNFGVYIGLITWTSTRWHLWTQCMLRDPLSRIPIWKQCTFSLTVLLITTSKLTFKALLIVKRMTVIVKNKACFTHGLIFLLLMLINSLYLCSAWRAAAFLVYHLYTLNGVTLLTRERSPWSDNGLRYSIMHQRFNGGRMALFWDCSSFIFHNNTSPSLICSFMRNASDCVCLCHAA